MDFHSLNRRQLQSLCKLNSIPANITNVAMADALTSLKTVEGIEEILNASRSETVGLSIESPEKVEVMSPRVPRTSCRTSTRQKVKKMESESVSVTASGTTIRGVRRNLGGDVSDLVKTPSVTSTRKKVPATASRQNVLTQLNECEEVDESECLVDQKKGIPNTPAPVATCNRRKVTTVTRQNTVKKETTVQGVYSTRRSTRLTAKKSAELGVVEKERNEPVKISSFLDEVSETSADNFGDSVPQKSTGSDYDSIETSHESSVTSVNTEDNVEEESAESCDVGVTNEKVEDICSAFEKLDVIVGDQNLMTEKPLHMDITVESVEEKEDCTSEIDSTKVSSGEVFEHHEMFDDLDEKRGQVENLIPKSEGVSPVCDDPTEEDDLKQPNPTEALNVSDNELTAHLTLKEHSKEKSNEVDDLKQDSEGNSIVFEDKGSEEKLMVIDENVDLTEALNVSDNELNACLAPEEHSEERSIKVDDLKQDSEIISNLCEDGDLEDKMMVIDEKNDKNEVVNVSVKELNNYLASEEHFVERSFQDNIKQDSEIISNLCEDGGSEEKIMVIDDQNEAFSVSVNDPNSSLTPEEHFNQKIDQVDNRKQDSEIISDVCKDGSEEKIMVTDDQNEAFNVSVNDPKSSLTPEEHFDQKIDQVDDFKQDSEIISNVCKDEDSEEKLVIKDENADCSETLNVSVKERNAYLSETDGTDSDDMSFDAEHPSHPSKLSNEDMSAVSEMKNEVSECNGSPKMVGDLIHENLSELSKLDNTDSLRVVVEMTVDNIEHDTSKSTVNVVPVIPIELDQKMDFESPKDAQVSLINETHVYLNSVLNQETETKAAADKVAQDVVADVSITKIEQFSAEANDVIDCPTFSEIPASLKEMTQISDNNENSGSKLQAEEDKNISVNAESMSIRQLKKQLKALTLKCNVKTNKDDKVVEARPALQAVCENQFATEVMDN